jgi:hypothetical protein
MKVFVINHIKPRGFRMSHVLKDAIILHFVFIGFVGFSLEAALAS